MSAQATSYRGYRLPTEIISHAVWLYHRFCLSFRDVEDLLAQRGILVSYETIRQWWRKFGPEYARRLRRRHGRLGDTWHLDELFVTIRGQRQYLWRAVDQDGDSIDILVQPRRDRRAAERFFRKLLQANGAEPNRLVTDKLRSYAAPHRRIMPSVVHDTRRYANNPRRSPTSRLGGGNDRCAGSNRRLMRNDSFPLTGSSTTSSGSGGIS
jgi:putative transposase